jgi:glutathione peroxidase
MPVRKRGTRDERQIMKNVRMMAWISIFIMLAACDFVDPHTLNIDVKKNEAGPTSSLQHSGGVENKKDGQIYDFTLFDIDAFPVSLNKFRGKVLLLVNTASRCGYTPQYEQLQQLYEQYQPRGLEILAFPSKDFGGQELETNEAIATFCYTRYSVDFPLFTGEVRWNFEKYLVDRKGSVIARYYSSVLPLSEEIISDLERTLAFQS